jgi:multidrug efflux pump subunit AcrA (membrane-fusion protein)
MNALSPNWRSGRLATILVAAIFAVAIAGGMLAYFNWRSVADSDHAGAAEEHAHDDGHDHGHAHDNANVVELSPAALKNIRYQPHTVASGNYERTISLPGIIVERAGQTVVRVSSPLTGRVTKIYVHEGEAIQAGSPLFDLRLTHEDLVTAQSEFLATADSLDVAKAELARREAVTEGAIAGYRILEQRYETQKLESRLKSQRQALLLHGLTDDQIDEILTTRYLVQSVTIRAPIRTEPDEHP